MVWALRSHAWSTVVLDSCCLITISGFARLHLLPDSAEQAGWMVLPLAMLGFILPSIAERTLHHGHPGMRKTVIWLAILGIAAHATLDGWFLNLGGQEHAHHDHQSTHELTAWAVILHRIPEGLGIWWIVPRTLGVVPAILVTSASIGATLFGYFLGDALLTADSRDALAMLQSLLVGSLLHVVLHAHIPAPREQGRIRLASVLGAAIGVAVLGFVIHDHFPQGSHGGPLTVFIDLPLESAPALLLVMSRIGFLKAMKLCPHVAAKLLWNLATGLSYKFTLRNIKRVARIFNRLLQANNFSRFDLDRIPRRAKRLRLFFKIGQLSGDRIKPFHIGFLRIFLQRRLFNFQLHDLAVGTVKISRFAIGLNPQMACRLIHHINRFIRQEPLIDIALRQARRCDKRIIRDPHTMVKFVFFFEAAKHKNRVFNRGFINKYRLESAC